MKKMHIAPMESISKPGERAPWLREGKWWRALMFASGLLLAAVSSTHAQQLIWAPASSDCSAASVGGGSSQTWHSAGTPKNWCTSIGGIKASWSDGSARFPDNNGVLNALTLTESVLIKALEFDGDTQLFGPGISFQVTTSPMLVSVASGKNANVYPTIGTNGAVEKIGAGTVTLLGPNNASPFRVLAGTVVIGVSWDGLYKGSLTSGTVDLASGTLKFNRSDSISFGLPVSGTANLEQAGSGVLTLTSTSSTHTGPVNVTAGTLFMDGSLASSTSPLTVSSGATLGGKNGSLSSGFRANRPVTLQPNAILAPGYVASGTVGTLNLGGDVSHTLTTSSGTQLNFELVQPGAPGDGSNDFVNVVGGINFGAGTVLNIVGSPGVGTYPLFKYTGSVSGTLPTTFTGVPSNMLAVVTDDTTNKVVNLQLIPATLRWAPNATNNADCTDNTKLGGTGNWDTGTPWCDSTNTRRAWVNGATAVFSNAGGTATITASSPQFNALDFQVSGMTITGGTLTGTIGSQTELKAGSSGFTNTINSALNGSLPYTKSGAGTLVLGGNNGFSSTMTVSAGTLRASSASGALGNVSGDTTVAPGAVLDIVGATVADNVILLGSAMLQTSTGNGVLSGGLTLGSGSTVNVAGSQLTLSGVVSSSSGTIPFTKTGAGVVILTGANTYTGATDVTAGTLRIGNGTTGSLNASSQVNLAATTTLGFARTDAALNFSNTITGQGAVLMSGSGGTVTLSGNNTYTGATNINAGTLAVAHANALGDSTPATAHTSVNSGGFLDIQTATLAERVVLNGGTLKASTGPHTLSGQFDNGGGTVDVVAGGTLTLSGLVSGAGTLTKSNGTGSLVISGTSNTSWTGAITVSNGTLLVNGNVGSSTTNAVTVNAGATLGGNGTISRSVSLGGASPKLEPGDAGAVGTLKTGDFTVSSGATAQLNFQLGSGGNDLVGVTGNIAFSGSAVVNITGTLGLGIYPLFKYTGNVTGLPTVGSGAPAGLTTTIEKDESDPLNKQIVLKVAPRTLYWAPNATNCGISTQWGGGSGNWNTSAANQVWCDPGIVNKVAWQQGATAVFPQSAGTVSVADAIQFESLVFSVAGYTLNAGGGGTLTGTSSVSTATTITTSHAAGTSTTIIAPLVGSLPHAKEGNGTLVLAGSNTFAGSIAVNGGTLQLGNGSGAAGSLATTSEVKLGGGNLLFNHSAPFTFSNTISGTGSVTKQGSSTLTLSGISSSYAGVTTVSNGTLRAASADALGAGGAGNGTVVDGSSTILELQADPVEPMTLQNSGKLLVNAGNRVLGGALSMGTAGGTVEVTTGAQLNLSASMGSGSTTLSKIGAGKLVMSADNSSHAGPILVGAGRLVAAHTNALGSTGGGTTVNSGAELELPAVTLSAETLTLSAGKLIASGASSTVGGSVTFSASSSGNTIQVDTELIVLGALGSGGTDASTAPSWSKSGAGRLDLRGSVAQWMGATDVTAGTLLVNGPNWSNAGQNLTVRNGAVIGGNGTVGQAINLQAGAKLEPGNPGLVGKLTMNQSVQAGTNSQLNFQLGELNVEGGTYNDFVTHNIGLGATGGTVNISETPGRTLVPGRYPLIRYADPTSGTPQLGTLPNANMKGMLENNPSTKLISLVLLTSPNLRWAPNAAADCSSGLGGAGTWNATNNNWCPEGGNSKVPWVPGATAVFTNTGGTVTVDGAQDIAGLTFETSAVSINAGTAASFTNSSASPTVLHSNAGVSNAKINLPLTGSLSYTKTGDGDVVLVNSHNFTGALTVANGRLLLGDGGATNGSVDSASSIQVLTGAVFGFNQNPASPYTFTRAVSGAGGLEKLGTNTVNLTGSHTYTGPTTVTAGTLQIGNGGTSGSISASSQVNLTVAGSTLAFNRTDATTSPITFANVITGLGGLSKPSTSTSTVVLTAENTYAGTAAVNGGILAITNAKALGGTGNGTTLGNGGVLDIRGVDVIDEPVTLSASASLWATTGISSLSGPVTLSGTSTVMDATTGAQLTLSGVVSGSALTKGSGAGTLVLSGSNTYTGTTTVNGGTLTVASISALGAADGTTTTGTTVANGAVLDIQGVAVGNERVALSGTTSTLKTTGSNDSSLGGPLVLSATSNNVIDVAGSSPLTLSGVISGSGPLTKSSGGRLLVTGVANTHTGTVTVAGGALLANGSLGSTGALTVAAGATLGGTGTINRSVVLSNGARLEPGGVDAGGSSTAANTFSTNALTVNSGAVLNFQLGSSPADYVTANGTLSFATSAPNVVLNVSGASADGVYPLFRYTGTAPTLTNVAVLGTSGQLLTRNVSGVNEVILLVGNPSLYWTPLGNCAGARGGNGDWNNTAQFWCDAATGGNLMPWLTGSKAVFTGNPSTVTVDSSSSGAVTFKELEFQTSSVAINGKTAMDVLTGTGSGAAVLRSTSAGNTGIAIGSKLAGGAYAKEGAGAVTLSGDNTFGGMMAVNDGTLVVNHANALGSAAGNTTVATGATLEVKTTSSIGENLTLAGTLSFTAGDTQLLTGTVTLAADSTVNVAPTPANKAAFIHTISGNFQLRKTGAGDWALALNSPGYTGAIKVDEGRFQLGSGGTGGSVGAAATVSVASGATLRFSHSGSFTFSNAIDGDGDVQNAGATVVLTGSNSYRGKTLVTGGTLQVDDGGSLGSTSDITLAGSLIFNRSGDVSLGAVIAGSGTLTQSGTGKLVLTGASPSYSGVVSVNAGALLVNGSLGSPGHTNAVTVASTAKLGGSGTINRPVTMNSGATLEPGGVDAGGASTPGKLTAGASTSSTFTAAGTLRFQLGEANQPGGASSLNDWVDVTGNLTFSAGTTLNVIPNGGALAEGTYPLFRYSGSTLTGLSNVSVTGATGLLQQSGNEVVLVVGPQTLYWAPPGTPCSGTLGGSGDWDTTTPSWCTAAVGGSKTTWIAGSTAVFTGNSSAVTVKSTPAVTFRDLDFQTSNAVVINGNTPADRLTGPSTGAAVLRNAGGTGVVTIGSVLAGAAYSKEGVGMITLSGDNTFTGTMSVNNGTLVAGHASALGDISGSTSVANGATLAIQGVAVGAEAVTLNGGSGAALSGTGTASLNGTVTLNAPSTIDVASSAALTLGSSSGITSIGHVLTKTGTGELITTATNSGFAAQLKINAGKFVVDDGTTGTGSIGNVTDVLIGTGAVLRFNRNNGVTFDKPISGGGGLEKATAGILTLKGNNTYGGETKVEEGTLQVGDGTASGSAIGTGSLTVNGGAFLTFNRLEDLSLNSSLAGAGTLTKLGAGTLTLGGNNTGFTGQTIVSAGTLSVGGGGTSGSIANTSGVNVGGGATLRFDRSDNLSFSAAISGAGALSKQGTGTLTLTGSHNYSGSTSVDGGTLLVNGTLASPGSAVTVTTGTLGGNGTINRPVTLNGGSAVLAPGDATAGGSLPGTLTVLGDFTMQGSSQLAFQLDGVVGPSSSSNDRVQVTGSLLFSGSPVLNVTLNSGSSLAAGNYILFTHTGPTPSGLAIGTLPPGVVDAVIQNNGSQVQLVVGMSTPTLSGKVFNDGSAGNPNDGVHQPTEAGLSGVAVSLSNCSGAVLASTVTDAAGTWAMTIPTAQVGNSVCVGPTLSSGYLATGASKAGVAIPDGSSSGGYTYSRAQHRLSFTAANGSVELDFGLVPVSQLSAGSTRTGAAGGNALHAHQFRAGTAGSVFFSTGLGTGVPSNDGWSETVYRDVNCSGTLQPDAPVLYPTAVPVSLAVTQGQTVCLLVQHGIPGSALNGQSRTVPLQAQLSFTNANPALMSPIYSVNDVTTVSTSQLDMLKEVRVVGTSAWSTSNEAKPGQELEYRITIRNKGPAPISDVRVTDHTPAYTFFKSASVEGSLPTSLGTCTKTTPAGAAVCGDSQASGGSGPIQWTFSGTLNAGPEVELRYVVEVK
jgi:fibronectin-binding autotransporter adhesin